MTGKDLSMAIGSVSDKHLLDAEEAPRRSNIGYLFASAAAVLAIGISLFTVIRLVKKPHGSDPAGLFLCHHGGRRGRNGPERQETDPNGHQGA